MAQLLEEKEMKLKGGLYHQTQIKLADITIGDIVDFHYRFESIHPFQDGKWTGGPYHYV